jgi:hypothetical protein
MVRPWPGGTTQCAGPTTGRNPTSPIAHDIIRNSLPRPTRGTAGCGSSSMRVERPRPTAGFDRASDRGDTAAFDMRLHAHASRAMNECQPENAPNSATQPAASVWCILRIHAHIRTSVTPMPIQIEAPLTSISSVGHQKQTFILSPCSGTWRNVAFQCRTIPISIRRSLILRRIMRPAFP